MNLKIGRKNMTDTSELQTCPKCKQEVSRQANQCPECGAPLNPRKTYKEAYGGMGLGLFDMIPVVRDLPYAMRYVLMAISFIFLFAVLFL
jgi:predicted amidophosphoribosyltransferase